MMVKEKSCVRVPTKIHPKVAKNIEVFGREVWNMNKINIKIELKLKINSNEKIMNKHDFAKIYPTKIKIMGNFLNLT